LFFAKRNWLEFLQGIKFATGQTFSSPSGKFIATLSTEPDFFFFRHYVNFKLNYKIRRKNFPGDFLFALIFQSYIL